MLEVVFAVRFKSLGSISIRSESHIYFNLKYISKEIFCRDLKLFTRLFCFSRFKLCLLGKEKTFLNKLGLKKC